MDFKKIKNWGFLLAILNYKMIQFEGFEISKKVKFKGYVYLLCFKNVLVVELETQGHSILNDLQYIGIYMFIFDILF